MPNTSRQLDKLPECWMEAFRFLILQEEGGLEGKLVLIKVTILSLITKLPIELIVSELYVKWLCIMINATTPKFVYYLCQL